MEGASPRSTSLWFIPSLDGQTIISITIGVVVSLVLFWLGYKKTIGAQEERLRAVNQELVLSVLKRVAVEREYLKSSHYQDLRTAKAYKSNVPTERLLNFNQVMAIVLCDVIDNNFLDQQSKNAIIELLDKSRQDNEILPKLASLTQSDRRESVLGLLAATASVLGTLVAISFSAIIKGSHFIDSIRSEEFLDTMQYWWFPLAMLVFLGTVFVTTNSVVADHIRKWRNKL